MVMETLQIRLGQGLIERIDGLVSRGIYSNRSDVIRDAVRRFVWENEAGTIAEKGNSVELIRKAREKLSRQPVNLSEINNL